MSFKAEIKTADDRTWVPNAIRFATKAECEAYVSDLRGRWSGVKEHRVTRDKNPVNYRWENGRAVYIIPEVLTREPVGYTEAEIERQQSRLAALFGQAELEK
jgi:hypothetical protein